MSRGRPPSVENQLIIEAVTKFKDKLVTSKGDSIVPETNPVWSLITNELSGKIKPTTLYSYVTTNRFDLRKLILGVVPEKFNVNSPDNLNSPSSDDCELESDTMFTLTFGKAEFDGMILETTRKYRDIKGNNRMRVLNILQPEKWTEIMAKKIYNDFRLPHGYHFESSYINQDRETGSFTGHCKCGSRLKCLILPQTNQLNSNQQLVKIECLASTGDGNCGKRQCRGETRNKVVSEFNLHSTELYRTTKAAEIMKEGDSAEPPILYNANVLRNAKYEFLQKQYRDSNPMTVLSKLKRSPEGENIIRDIGLDPVFIHFWSSHQIRIYNDMVKSDDSRLCIDATGGIAKHCTHVDNELSQHIFMYLAVLYVKNGQIPVSASFSERQDTVTISTWLRRWIQSGAKFPKEVVCDSSKALLNACCWAFTGHDQIEAYAEACMGDFLPRTYIRIDIAHYLKNWAVSLKNEKTHVKKFYMFCIGQLILCRNIKDAERITKALLLISLSENAGNGANSLKQSLEYLKGLINEETSENKKIGETVEETLREEHDSEPDDAEQDFGIENKSVLLNWINDIKTEVDEILSNEDGDDINPRFCPKFATRLQKQLKIIPLWSCVTRDTFGFGRIPASSAPVESEFKIIKKQVLPKVTRIDLAVETLIKHYSGKLKIIECWNKANDPKEKVNVEDRVGTKRKTSEKFNDDASGSENESLSEDTLEISDYESESHDENLSDESFEKYRPTFQESQVKDMNVRKNHEKPSTCLACLNGYVSTGAHKCIICDANVHLLPGCSVAVEDEEEGFGQRRICKNCNESSTRKEAIALNEFENWRNKGHPRKKTKQSYYLSKTNQDLFDVITSTKCRTLPIIKNGNDSTLGLVALGNAKFSVANTCALDSIFQIILAGFVDQKIVKDHVNKYKHHNLLFEMVAEVAKTRIQAKTYQKRTEIYIDHHNIKVKSDSIQKIEGSCNVVSLANSILKCSPSFQEIAHCTAGCDPRIKSLATITITEKQMKKPLGEVIKELVVLPKVQCRHKNCDQMEENEFHMIGDLVIIGVDTEQKIDLEFIPRIFKCPKTKREYCILGFVDYNGPTAITRRPNAIGHYTAFVRRNTNWIVYDDLKSKAVLIKKNKKLHPELLIYSRKA